MREASDQTKPAGASPKGGMLASEPLHPGWRAFIRYCTELQHGEIEMLKIQDGLPVLATVTRKKVKFVP
jgi:hypothetical protein